METLQSEQRGSAQDPDLPVKKTVIWFTAAALSAASIDLTFTLQSILAGLMIAILLPVPNLLVALLFKQMRNPRSLLKIIRGWHFGWFLLTIITHLYFLQDLSEEIRSVGSDPVASSSSPTKYGRDDEAQISQNDETKSEVLVLHTKETDADLEGMVINLEMVEALEKNYQQGMISNYKQQLASRNLDPDAYPRVVGQTSGTILTFDVPVGFVVTRLKAKEMDGDGLTKYLFVAGIRGSTLHNVVCMQNNEENGPLMLHPKCNNKLRAIYGELKS